MFNLISELRLFESFFSEHDGLYLNENYGKCILLDLSPILGETGGALGIDVQLHLILPGSTLGPKNKG